MLKCSRNFSICVRDIWRETIDLTSSGPSIHRLYLSFLKIYTKERTRAKARLTALTFFSKKERKPNEDLSSLFSVPLLWMDPIAQTFTPFMEYNLLFTVIKRYYENVLLIVWFADNADSSRYNENFNMCYDSVLSYAHKVISTVFEAKYTVFILGSLFEGRWNL